MQFMGTRTVFAPVAALALGVWFGSARAEAREKEKSPELATIEVHTGQDGCLVDLDSGPPSKTEESGVLFLRPVDPGDHYLHISCPDGRKDSFLVTPLPGTSLRVELGDGRAPAGPELSVAERQMRLREHIQQVVRLRARGRIDEAVMHLREARRLDPENSDLHRELGITFLLGKDWKRARIEMLEAIRNDFEDAEAHNGLAYAYEKMGKFGEAVEAYRTASKLEPSDSSYRRHYFNAIAKQAEQDALKKK